MSDFGSGHDLMVHGFEPCIGLCTDSGQPTWDSLSSSLSAHPPLMLTSSLSLTLSLSKINQHWGAWVAQSVKRLTLAQVMISRFVGLSPALGFVVTARSLEPASDSVFLFLCPSPAHTLSLCVSKINKTLKTFF